MTILDSVKGTVNTAVDTISSVAQTIVEKNRTNAKLNRLRLVMKSESELMNRAYIALGKVMYDSRKKGTEINDAECEKLLKVIDTSKAKIAKARECYRKIVNSSNDIFYGNPEVAPEVKEDDIVDGKLDTSRVKAFKAKAGDVVEVYATTLHYAPCNATKDGCFKVVIALPKGTNGAKPNITPVYEEDKTLWACNKWLLAHAESDEAKQGAYVGLTGVNVDIKDII